MMLYRREIYLVASLMSFFIFFGCRTSNLSNKESLNQGQELTGILSKLFDATRTTIVTTRMKNDVRAISILMGKFSNLDTMVFIRKDLYGSQNSSILGFSLANTIEESVLAHIQYSNKTNKVEVNEVILDYFQKAEIFNLADKVFNLSKRDFLLFLKADRENHSIMSNGGVSLQYIFIYNSIGGRYSMDIYNLTK